MDESNTETNSGPRIDEYGQIHRSGPVPENESPEENKTIEPGISEVPDPGSKPDEGVTARPELPDLMPLEPPPASERDRGLVLDNPNEGTDEG